MIQISNAQLTTYQSQLDGRLAQKILAFLKEECAAPLNRFTDPMILRIVDRGIRKARRYGLESDYAITSFVGLMVEVGFAFDEQPRIQKILRMTRLDDNQRVDFLIKGVTEQEWQEASRLEDSDQ